jgi:hypothetical protein
VQAKVKCGIFVGRSEDKDLLEIYALRNKVHTMWHRSETLSLIHELNHRLNNTFNSLSEDNCTLVMANIAIRNQNTDRKKGSLK